MQRIFSAGEYAWALFLGHLAIEKLLKACCARQLGSNVPKIHDLTRLAKRAGLSLTAEQEDCLDRLTMLQVNVRYHEERVVLRGRAGKMVAKRYMKEIAEIREWLVGVLSE